MSTTPPVAQAVADGGADEPQKQTQPQQQQQHVELVAMGESKAAPHSESKEEPVALVKTFVNDKDNHYHDEETAESLPHCDGCCKPDSCCYNDWSTLPKINPCCASPKRPCCMKGENCMERFFEGIGVEIAKRPWLSMILSFLIVAGLAYGYAIVEEENRPDKLWIPTGAPALFHKAYVEETWPSSQRIGLWIATCKDVATEDCNILEAKYVNELNRIDHEIKDIIVDSAYALEMAGITDFENPYAANYSFVGDEDKGVEQLCFLLGSTGAVCGEGNVLATFRNDIPDDLTDQSVLDQISFYPTQLGFCPLTISDPDSPCRNTTAYNPNAAHDDCQVFSGSPTVSNCHLAFNNYCGGDKCPNWVNFSMTAEERAVGCEEESCLRSSWYLARDEPTPTFLAEMSSLMSSGQDGPTVNAAGDVVAAEALFGYYMLATSPIVIAGDESDPIAEEWEKAALCKLGIIADPDDPVYNTEACENPSDLLEFTAQFARSLGDEFGSEILGDLPKIGGSFAIVIVYLVLMLSRRDYVHSMIGMSIVCILTVGLSYAGCIGFGAFVGWKNNNLNLNIPFLLLGLGVDDAFVISSEFLRTYELYPTMPVQQRTVFAAKHGGVSVLITSVTDALAFLVGSSTVLPALSWFCAFCGVGILMCFFLQIFLFLPALQINAMRANADYYDLWCCCKSKRRHEYTKPLGCCGCCKTEWCPPGILGTMLHKFGVCVTSVGGAVVTIICFAGLLGAGIYGCTQLYKDFQIEWFVPDDSYLADFYELNAYYFGTGVTFTVYTTEFDYYQYQESFVHLYQAMTSADYIDQGAGFSSWHQGFMADYMLDNETWPLLDCYVTATGEATTLTESNKYDDTLIHCLYNDETEFYTRLMQWYEFGGWNLLSGNILWKDSTCDDCEGTCAADTANPECNYQAGILATTLDATLTIESTNGGQVRYDTMTTVRADVSECFPTEDGSVPDPGDELAFPYSRDFPNWEEVGTIDQELWKNLGICFGVIVVIIAALIPKPQVAVWVIVCIVMAIVDILGFLYFWGITISGVSTIFVLISVGLAVDYSAHIAHMFAESSGHARDRAVKALGRIGPSVFNAIFSTLLAVIVLASSTSFIYEVFFRVLCLTVLFAGAHGLWLLPVLLAYAGGHNVSEDNDEESGHAETGKSGKYDAGPCSEPKVDHEHAAGTGAVAKTEEADDVAAARKLEEGEPVRRTSTTA